MGLSRVLQVRVTDEEYESLQKRALGESVSAYVRECLFGDAPTKPVATKEPTMDPLLASHLKWSKPVEVVPINSVQAYRQAAAKPEATPIVEKPALNSVNPKIVELQKQIVAMEKKPVKRGAVAGNGYVPKKRYVEPNDRGEYDEPVIDVDA